MEMSEHFQLLRIRLLVTSALLVAPVVNLPEAAQSRPSPVKLVPQQVVTREIPRQDYGLQ